MQPSRKPGSRPAALYRQLADAIEKEIADGIYPGELPRQIELAKRFKVGHDCMSNAYRELKTRGVISTEGNGRAARYPILATLTPPKLDQAIICHVFQRPASGEIYAHFLPEPPQEIKDIVRGSGGLWVREWYSWNMPDAWAAGDLSMKLTTAGVEVHDSRKSVPNGHHVVDRG